MKIIELRQRKKKKKGIPGPSQTKEGREWFIPTTSVAAAAAAKGQAERELDRSPLVVLAAGLGPSQGRAGQGAAQGRKEEGRAQIYASRFSFFLLEAAGSWREQPALIFLF